MSSSSLINNDNETDNINNDKIFKNAEENDLYYPDLVKINYVKKDPIEKELDINDNMSYSKMITHEKDDQLKNEVIKNEAEKSKKENETPLSRKILIGLAILVLIMIFIPIMVFFSGSSGSSLVSLGLASVEGSTINSSETSKERIEDKFGVIKERIENRREKIEGTVKWVKEHSLDAFGWVEDITDKVSAIDWYKDFNDILPDIEDAFGNINGWINNLDDLMEDLMEDWFEDIIDDIWPF